MGSVVITVGESLLLPVITFQRLQNTNVQPRDDDDDNNNNNSN